MRLFVALALPDSERERLAGLQRGLKSARWVTPENFHLTLRFVGEVDRQVAEDVDDALMTLRFDSFPLSLKGVGCFGEERKVRSLWVGVEDNPLLMRLQAKIERRMLRSGLTPEPRKFKPHVTLARFKGAFDSRVESFLADNARFRSLPFMVEQVILYSSSLGRGGAVYHPEVSYPLRTEGPTAAFLGR